MRNLRHARRSALELRAWLHRREPISTAWRGASLAGLATDAGKGVPGAESAGRSTFRKFLWAALPVSGVAVLGWGFAFPDADPLFPQQRSVPPAEGEPETLVNWSGTHEVNTKHFYQPHSPEEVEQLVREAHNSGRKLRVVGSALSPNGIGFSEDGMMSMSLLDKILWVDKEKGQVRLQAGCRVQQVADALKPHGLSLQNYASIREQQIGGFTQVSAHGTGATIPPVDEQVVSMRLVTPGRGTLELNRSNDPELFDLARVGLGSLGVVTELTMQCVPEHQLLERTFTASRQEVKQNHDRWLRENRHLRYMWLPYTDTVVVVQCNLVGSEAAAAAANEQPARSYSEAERLEPLRRLYKARSGASDSEVEQLTWTQLRDALLASAPLDTNWVKQVNQAEAEYWKRSAGTRVGWTDEILGFDCGGQQWVLEIAFPAGRYSQPAGSSTASNTAASSSRRSWWGGRRSAPAVAAPASPDIAYMEELLSEIDAAGIPAHCPIEQRWTARSGAPMSPASSMDPDSVHSWVGIIMYLPTDDPAARDAITNRFCEYGAMVQAKLMPKYGAVWHWAKIEPPTDAAQLQHMRARLAERYPLEKFREARQQLDPKNVLSNRLIDELLD